MFSIDLDLAGLAQLEEKLVLLGLALQEAIPVQLAFIQSTWVAAVSGHKLAGMTRTVEDPRYAAMIAQPACLQYPFNGDAFEGRVIATDGDLVSRYEEGYGSFDMKPGLLSGPNAKMGKHGAYNTVPFTHSTPGSQGQNGNPMPQDIYAQARKLADGARLTGHGDRGKVGKNPFVVNLEAKVRGLDGPMKSPYNHKTSPFEGMVRTHKAGHTSYHTFRRVSEGWVDSKGVRHGSDPSSWIHPGLSENPVVRSVFEHVAPLVRAALIAEIDALGFRAT
jgi:hypothetical protein